MTHRKILEFDGADPLSSRLDQVLLPIRDVHVSVAVDGRNIPRREPPVTVEGFAFLSVVATEHPWATHLELAEGLPVTGQRIAFLIHDLHLHAVDGPPLPNLNVVALLGRRCPLLRLEHVDRPDGAHFRHAPTLPHLDTKLLVERLYHRARHRSPADDHDPERRNAGVVLAPIIQQSRPNRRYAGRTRDAFFTHQLGEAGAVQRRARHDEFDAGHGRSIGGSPRIGVKQGHDRQERLGFRKLQNGGERDTERVEHAGPMTVQHAFGISRSSGCVTERRSGVFIEIGPHEAVILGVQEVLITQEVRQPRLRHVIGVGHDHDALHGFQVLCNRLDERNEGEVDEQKPILRVIEDIDQL